MANTSIRIKRSTTATAPTSLQNGELAFTSNGDTLWIGSPSGSNVANVIHIGAKISYIGNSTQIGASAGGSNSELASTYAIKQFVDGKLLAYASNLSDLDDVTIATVANNDILVYDNVSGKWENHTVSGTTNEVNVSFSSHNIVVGLPDNVTITSNLTVNSSLTVNQSSQFNNTVITQVGVVGSPHTVTNPTIQIEANTNNWTQVSIANRNPGVNASADFIAYPNNTQNDDNTGYIDVGITSNGYNQAAYSITYPNDGYVFASARSGDNLSGSLVLATDSSGTNNDIKFFAGGFTFNANAPHIVLTANTRNFGINNANPTSRLTVGGTAWINGKLETNDVIPLANVTYSLGNTTNRYLHLYSNTVTGSNANFTTLTGALSTGNQPNITNVGTLDVLTVTGLTTLNGNLVSNAFVANNFVPSANLTYDLGSSTNYWRNVYSGNGYFSTLTVTGDLTVQGTVTTVDTDNIVVEDPLIRLARNQANTGSFTDAVDIGFYGVYGNTSSVVYTGLARDASANVFVLFDGLTQTPDNVINTNAITIASLTAYLSSGALISNSSAVTITANSTVNVNITANTLSLSSALGVASGGTGRNSLTNNAIVVGNTAGAVTLLSSSTEGHVLQIDSSGVPTFGMLDGGTF